MSVSVGVSGTTSASSTTVAFAPLPASARTEVIRAVGTHNADNSGTTYLRMRVQTAAYLVFGSPHYQIIR